MTNPRDPVKVPRWQFDATSHVGPTYVQVCLGIRLTVAKSAIAFFLDLFLFEVMVQYNRKPVKLGG